VIKAANESKPASESKAANVSKAAYVTTQCARNILSMCLATIVVLLLDSCGGRGALTVKAPELDGGTDWLNSTKPLKLSELKGKIVLLDFWNLSCVNCFHTIPIIKALEDHYPNDLVVIGIHSPKYSSEKDTKPLQEAVLRMEMDHPVVNDAENQIWTTYGVKGYPTIVLIDPSGGLVKMMIGERSYQQLDKQVKQLIDEFKAKGQLDERPLSFKPENANVQNTPLLFPEKLCVDPKRRMLFIADSGHNRVVVTDLSGKLLNVIGTGKIGSTDGTYATAEFHHPRGLAIDGNNLYVADTQNQKIRKVDLAKQVVTTISGDGQLTEILAPPELGKAKDARLNSPWDLVVAKNKLYIAMAGSHQLYDLDLAKGDLFVFAGSGDEGLHDGPLLTADLAQPSGIAFGADKIFFADSESNSIRSADINTSTGKVSTITGKGLEDFGDTDGPAAKAFLQHPLGVTVSGKKIYVADTLNHKIKVIDFDLKIVRTVWGSGKPGDADGDHPQFNEPNGIAIIGDNVYIADTNNNVIKVGNLKTGRVSKLHIAGLNSPSQKSQ
jgi:thiol-disulfide isomerase/thioredoxin